MQERTKKKWLRLLDEAEKNWRLAKWGVLDPKDSSDMGWKMPSERECPLCVEAKRVWKRSPLHILGHCNFCIIQSATENNCLDSIIKAEKTKNRRPIFDLIRKCRKWLEEN